MTEEKSDPKNSSPSSSPKVVKAESVGVTKETYGDNFQNHLLEQYKTYVEMMDRISARRSQMNSFYISLLSGILAFLSLISNKDISKFQNSQFQAIAILAIAILGIILCFVWYSNIQSYKQLNSGKFKVINEMEKYLPFPCYDREWEFLKKDNRYKGYLPQTQVEKYVPFILAIPYLGLFIYSLFSLL
jgi:hypothetical protein